MPWTLWESPPTCPHQWSCYHFIPSTCLILTSTSKSMSAPIVHVGCISWWWRSTSFHVLPHLWILFREKSVPFKTGLLILLYCWSSSAIPATDPLSVNQQLAIIFSHSCFFTVDGAQKFYISMLYILSVFYCCLWFWCHCQETITNPVLWVFPPCFHINVISSV